MCSPCTTSALRFGTQSCHLMIQLRYIRRVVKRKQDTCGILQGIGETFFADTRYELTPLSRKGAGMSGKKTNDGWCSPVRIFKI